MGLAPSHFVLDGSVTMAWCFPDERTDYAQEVLGSLAGAEAAVSAVWPVEIANTLLVGERRRRLTVAAVTEFLEQLVRLPITIDPQTPHRALTAILSLARAHNLSSYDASYLDLAMRLHYPLATLDGPLRQAAERVGVALFVPAVT